MSKYPIVELGSIATVVSGSTPKTNKSEYWNGEYNWVTPAELREDSFVIYETERKISKKAVIDTGLKVLPKGTVLLSSRAPIGKVAIAGTEMYCNQGFKNLICSDKINNKYLFWFLKGKANYLNYLGRGATFKEISKAIVEKIKTPLPPIEIQKQIAKTLDTVSEILAMRKQQLIELNNLIKSVFYDMFGDPIKNTKGWERKELSNCCYVNPKKSEINCFTDNLEVSFVSMASVSEKGDINTNEIKLYKEVKAGFTYFYENDVLFAKITPCMENGKGAIARGLKNNIGFGSTEFHVLRPKNGISNSEWLYHLTALPVFRDSAEKNMTGSAGQKRVPVSFFDKFFVPLPPISLQDEFATIVTKIEAQKSLVKKSIEETQLLFDSLMSQYFDE